MRKFLLAVAILCIAQGARAADMPDLPVLRGAIPEGLTTRVVNWQGFYVGGQAGIGESDMNFSGSTRTLAAQVLSNTDIEAGGQVSQWGLLGKTSQRGEGWGGFAGYNSQWDDVVIGLELSYIHGKFGGSQTNTVGRSFGDPSGYLDNINYKGTSAFSIADMGTLRARAGYAWGCFLPYLFGGVALGQADITQSVLVTGTQDKINPATVGFNHIDVDLSGATGEYSHLIYGYSGGLGVDINLIGGLFMRAEWEYVRFTSKVDVSVNTARVGVGYKF